MKKHAESHLDHNLTDAQIAFITERFAERDAFFIESVTLPAELGTVPCGLHGPLVGDPPVPEETVTRAPRGSRAWPSRLIELAPKPSNIVTVIAGPHEETCATCAGTGERQSLDIPYGNHPLVYPCTACQRAGKIKHACILYTCYGGPLAPQEPDDPGCRDGEASRAFWSQHALSK